MDKFKNVLLILCVSFLLSSCFFTSKQDFASINNLTTDITLAYNRLALKLLSEGNFTDKERVELHLLDRKAKFIIKEFTLIRMKNEVSSEEAYHLYKRVKALYIECSILIKKRYDKQPDDVKLILYKFDYAASKLDLKVESAADDVKKRVAALENVQIFMMNIIKIVIPLILV